MSTIILLTLTGLALAAMYFLLAAGLSLLMGLMPRPFVAAATKAHVVVAHPHGEAEHPNASHYGGHGDH